MSDTASHWLVTPDRGMAVNKTNTHVDKGGICSCGRSAPCPIKRLRQDMDATVAAAERLLKKLEQRATSTVPITRF